MSKTIYKEELEQYEFIPYLLKYFLLSPDNKVTGNGIFPHSLITYYQDDNRVFHKIVDMGDGREPMDYSLNSIDLDTLLAIISQLETLPSTKFNFKNMKEQVQRLGMAYIRPLGGR